MTREWEIFKGRFRSASSKTMRVTLNKRNLFALNHAAYIALGSPEAVEMLYDRINRVIGFRSAEKSARHVYPVRSQKNARAVLVAGDLFCKTYDLIINKDSILTFDPVMEDGILVLELDKAVLNKARKRQTKRTSNDEVR